jgi:L,D-transpeptidase catalytic domain
MLHRPARAAFVVLLVSMSGVALDAASTPSPASAFTSAGRLDPAVFQLALSTARCAQQTLPVSNGRLLTLIDYSRPSTAPRLWVIDMETEKVLFEELVAHGRGSGDNLTEHFSNEPGSLASSLGLFLTGETYVGSNGYSLRLQGLEQGVNDRAYERAIVMHGAPYVRAGMDRLGRLGRSWGCPAVRPAIARQLIDTIKGGTLLLAYYPDAQWLTQSRFLHACGAPGASAAD